MSPVGGGRYATPQTFTPLSLSPEAWYDASVASSITSSLGFVSQWNDLSGNIRHVTATLLARPTTASHTINSLNVLAFDGVANWLQNLAITTVAGNAHTWFAVFKPTAAITADRVLSLAKTGDNDYSAATDIAAILRNGGGGNTQWSSFYQPKGFCGNNTVTNAAAHQLTIQRNGDAHAVFVDGATGTTATGLGTAAFAINQIGIGSDVGEAGNFYPGDIAEILWYSTVLSTGNRQLVEAYLKAKWGTP